MQASVPASLRSAALGAGGGCIWLARSTPYTVLDKTTRRLVHKNGHSFGWVASARDVADLIWRRTSCPAERTYLAVTQSFLLNDAGLDHATLEVLRSYVDMDGVAGHVARARQLHDLLMRVVRPAVWSEACDALKLRADLQPLALFAEATNHRALAKAGGGIKFSYHHVHSRVFVANNLGLTHPQQAGAQALAHFLNERARFHIAQLGLTSEIAELFEKFALVDLAVYSTEREKRLPGC